MANDKTFVGKTNVINTKYGEIVKISFGPKDFAALEEAKGSSGWVNLELKSKRDGGRYLQVQPEWTGGKSQPVNGGDDLPF